MLKSGTLTKTHIVEVVAEANGFTRRKSVETVETVLELIKRSLESGEDVLISGCEKFSVKQKAKRKGRNPATGENMMLKRRRVVSFKCSGKLGDKLVRDYLMSDQYMTKIHEYWSEITGMYAHFEDQKPIVEFEPNSGRIIA
jgi:integration host factor subunit alpha